jgi:hypothetical protein
VGSVACDHLAEVMPLVPRVGRVVMSRGVTWRLSRSRRDRPAPASDCDAQGNKVFQVIDRSGRRVAHACLDPLAAPSALTSRLNTKGPSLFCESGRVSDCASRLLHALDAPVADRWLLCSPSWRAVRRGRKTEGRSCGLQALARLDAPRLPPDYRPQLTLHVDPAAVAKLIAARGPSQSDLPALQIHLRQELAHQNQPPC